jgi:hypothetical protein
MRVQWLWLSRPTIVFFLCAFGGSWVGWSLYQILGLIWAVWHVPLFLHQEFSAVHGTVIFSTTIVCYSVVMTAVFLQTRQSVLIAIAIHWTFNVSYYLAARHLFPDVDGGSLAFNYTRLGVFVGVAVLVVFASARGPSSRCRRSETARPSRG